VSRKYPRNTTKTLTSSNNITPPISFQTYYKRELQTTHPRDQERDFNKRQLRRITRQARKKLKNR
jgi:hypothetical protein